jgi:putative ABC transport system substrate-binding protein
MRIGERREATGNSKNHKLFRFALCALLLALSFPANAQERGKIPRIGFLSVGSVASASARIEAFRQGLRALGYVEGKNVLIEFRGAEGKNDQLPDLAAELVRFKVDLIIADSTLAARPTKAATKTIPIVVVSGDPVGTALVASLARPGGNITGVTNLSPDLSSKRLELLKESVPGVARIAVLWDAEGPVPLLAFKEIQEAAGALGLQIQSLEVRGPKPDFESAFKAAMKSRAGALLAISNPLINRHRDQIVERAGKNRLPAIYADRQFVDVGGLMSYGVDEGALYSRLAYYVDKILKGAKPADLPVEQPTKFELAINLKTAKQIGLTIPPNVLARADKVIK